MPLPTWLARTWAHIQGNLFPWLTEELGPLTEAHERVIMTLELAGIETFVQVGLPGRPPHDRVALARAFVVKAVLGLPTTSMLIERLTVDKPLRRLCGWEHPGQVSSEATSSRRAATRRWSSTICSLCWTICSCCWAIRPFSSADDKRSRSSGDMPAMNPTRAIRGIL
jgi:Transposase domain (DUF772)